MQESVEIKLPKKKVKTENKGGKIIKTFFDSQENKIISTESALIITVELKLVSEKRRRLVGVLTKSTGVFNVVRNREKHLHRQSNSYGFNFRIFEMSNHIKTVVLSDELMRYKIPIRYILENTNFLFFKQQGFELQTFISLEQLNQFRVPFAF